MAASKPGGWKTRIIPETGAAGEAENDTGGRARMPARPSVASDAQFFD
jgi:hypothetical protein